MNKISFIRNIPIGSLEELKYCPDVARLTLPNNLCSDVFEKTPIKTVSMEEVVEKFKDKFDLFLENDFEDFEILAPLTREERSDLIWFMEDGFSDLKTFCMFAFGQKPALLLSGDSEYINLAKKIKSDDKVSAQVTIGEDDEEFSVNQLFLFNRLMVQNIINENKALFISRLGLDKDVSLDFIYSKLISKDGVIAQEGATIKSRYNDVIGLILGFPKISSLIYELEKRMTNPQLRYAKDLTGYKQELINVLSSEESPYKNMSKEFLDNLKEKINLISEIKHSASLLCGFDGYPFMYYLDEPEEISKIQLRIIETVQRMENKH